MRPTGDLWKEFKYLDRILMASDDYWPEVVTYMQK